MAESTDYSVGQKVIHWIMAFFIILDLFVAQKFGGVMEDWDRLESRVDHGSMGTIIGVLFILRIILRIRHGAPPLPGGMPIWQEKAARIAHWLLYFFIGFLILSGLTTAANATAPVLLFGALDITIGQSEETTFRFVRQFHEFATNAVIALIGIHVFAAIYHHFVVKDDSTSRILRFWTSK